MEAESVEDSGAGIKFNVYCYNVQPGIGIDYTTGDSWVGQESVVGGESDAGGNADTSSAGNVSGNSSDTTEQTEYIINTNTGKFHKPSCSSVKKVNNPRPR